MSSVVYWHCHDAMFSADALVYDVWFHLEYTKEVKLPIELDVKRGDNNM